MTYKFNIQPALRYAVWELDDIDVTILVSFPTLSIRMRSLWSKLKPIEFIRVSKWNFKLWINIIKQIIKHLIRIRIFFL